MQVTTLESDATLAEVCGTLDRDGCVIVRDFVGKRLADSIRRELDPYLRRTPNGEGYFVGRKTRRLGGLVVKSPSARHIITHPLVLGTMDHVLAARCSSYRLNLTQAVCICPGEVEQIFHKDDELFPFPHDGWECMANVFYAYDDFTRENGATRVVPGSHREPLDREPPEDRIAHATMSRGSVLIYLGSTTHSGGANLSAHPRTGIAFSYALGWLRQSENQYLAVPPEIARGLPQELQRLIGYAIHAPNLGWYEGQDPGVVLKLGYVESLAARDYMPPEAEALLKQRDELLRAVAV
jgi:ectoine hydroxylase-related dioxygenase (phytanoyl-CoA dioxygenase family)